MDTGVGGGMTGGVMGGGPAHCPDKTVRQNLAAKSARFLNINYSTDALMQ